MLQVANKIYEASEGMIHQGKAPKWLQVHVEALRPLFVLLLNTISVEFDLPTPAHRPKPIDHD
jgi:hypothetical protein